MGRDRHDGPGAILHEHVVGHPDGDEFAVHRVDRVTAGEDPGLLLLAAGALDRRSGHGLRHVALDLRLLRGAAHQIFHQRVLGRQDEEGGAEKRVGTGGENHDLPAGDGVSDGRLRCSRISGGLIVLEPARSRLPGSHDEHHLGSFGAPDPVPLHGDHPLRPRLELIEIVEQALGVVGDAEEPLPQLLRLHNRVAPFAATLDHLFVGQHGLTRRAPVHRRFLLESEALVVELDEEPLGPLVVVGPAGGQLPAPIDGHAQTPELPVDRGDGAFGELGRMLARLDGDVLGVQPERVVAHGVQHPLTLVAAEAGYHVAHGVVLHVTHMGATRRIGEHLEHVGRSRTLARRHLLIGRIGNDKGLFPVPDFLPLGLDGFWVVRYRHGFVFLSRAQPGLAVPDTPVAPGCR